MLKSIKYQNSNQVNLERVRPQVQKRLPPLESGSALAEAGRTVAVGTAVGMTATCFNAPFDVVKSRFQSRLPGSGGSEPRRTFPLLAHIYATEGPRALYKGTGGGIHRARP